MFVRLKTRQTCHQKTVLNPRAALFIIYIIIIIIIFNKRVWGRGGMGLSGEGRA